MHTLENKKEQDLIRKDFFESLDLQFDQGDNIDIEECEIIFLYFLEISADPLLTILKKYNRAYLEMHKSFLIQKIESLNFTDSHFEYIVKYSSFNTLDLLSILPFSFYIPFCRYICNKKYYYFLENLLDYKQVYKVFEDQSIWIPLPWFTLEESYVDVSYEIIKKLISTNVFIKRNFISSINEIIKRNQDRNKIVHNKEDVISDKEAYSLNLLINRFLEIIINRKMNISNESSSFTNFIFKSKIEIFKISFVKMIEERKMLKIEEEDTTEIDKLLKNIVNEKRFGEYLGEMILNNKDSFEDLSIGSVYLYIYEVFPPDISVLTFLFQFDLFKQQILRILVHNPNIIKFSLFNNIIDYYNKIQKEDHKIEIRYLVNLILVDNSTLILKTCKRNTKFINYLMGDFEYCLSRGLNGLIEMNNILYKLYKTDMSSLEIYKNLIIETRIQKNRISSSFVFVDICLRLLIKIIDKNVDLLLVDELIEIFVKILNCNLKMIVGPKCSQLVIKNPFVNQKSPLSNITKESLNFKPKELLRNIFLIYLGIKNKKFVKCVCKEGMYFDIDLFLTGLEICENKFLLNTSQIGDLKDLIKQFREYNSHKEVEDIEEGFYDPVTYDQIKDPIKLLTSNVTVDRSTYNMIMLNDGIDPFNRLPLDDTKIREDVEMKQKIENIKQNKK